MREDMYPVGQLCAQIPVILKDLTFDIMSQAWKMRDLPEIQ